jgi:hypothetical protein
VFFQVSDSTLFVGVVERDRYLDANSLVYGSRAVSFMAGPSLGGILTQALSAPLALLIDAASFLGSAGFLSSISPAEPEPQPLAPGHLPAGVRYIRRTPTLFYELASTATVNFFNLRSNLSGASLSESLHQLRHPIMRAAIDPAISPKAFANSIRPGIDAWADGNQAAIKFPETPRSSPTICVPASRAPIPS